jgi:hypothetical protein
VQGISAIMEEDSEGEWATVPLEEWHTTVALDAKPRRRDTMRFDAAGSSVAFPAIRRAHVGARDFASDESLSSTPQCVPQPWTTPTPWGTHPDPLPKTVTFPPLVGNDLGLYSPFETGTGRARPVPQNASQQPWVHIPAHVHELERAEGGQVGQQRSHALGGGRSSRACGAVQSATPASLRSPSAQHGRPQALLPLHHTLHTAVFAGERARTREQGQHVQVRQLADRRNPHVRERSCPPYPTYPAYQS